MAAPKLNAPLPMVPLTTKELGWEEYPNYCLTILNSSHFSSFFFFAAIKPPRVEFSLPKTIFLSPGLSIDFAQNRYW